MTIRWLCVMVALTGWCSACATGGPPAPPREAREAMVLLGRYETVFQVWGDALRKASNSGDKARRMSAVMPYSLLGSALASLPDPAEGTFLRDSTSVLVGVRDFRPPRSRTNLGPARSTFCYLVVSRGAGVDPGAHGAKPAGQVLGHAAWTWSFPDGEGGPDWVFHGSLIGRRHLLVCSDPSELQAVAAAMLSRRAPAVEGDTVRQWTALHGQPVQGLRLLRGRAVEPWEGAVLSRTESLTFVADPSTGRCALRLRTTAELQRQELADLATVFPAGRSAGPRIWELNITPGPDAWDEVLGAMMFMGFVVYL